MDTKSFLIVQTAFIGDAILASSLLEKLHQHYPNSKIDLLVRKGNDGLFKGHPFINELIVWDKAGGKYKNLFKLLKKVRKSRYDYLINLQRFASTGLFAAFSKAKEIIGFKKNPFSFLFNVKIEHEIGNGKHEVERNQMLISHITDNEYCKPKLYPGVVHFEKVEAFKERSYITISPSSVWFTKQFPFEKWIELINSVDEELKVYLIGGPGDKDLCDSMKQSCNNNVEVLAGKLNFLESAALMKDAKMNFTNDSAPLHIASAMNAPVTAMFCSTVPGFGFGPLSDNSRIIETEEKLDCRPCGLHGKKECPKKHFKCGFNVDLKQIVVV